MLRRAFNLRWLGRLARQRAGMATVEFALLAVPMVLLFVAGGEMAQAIITSRNVEALASTLTNLGSQQTTCLYSTCTPSTNASSNNAITTGTLDQIMAASAAIMGNVSLTPLTMVLSEVDIVNNSSTGKCCSFTVRWSYQYGGGTLRGGSACAADTLTQVNPTSTPPAPGSVAQNLMPVPPAVNSNTNALVNPEAILIADVNYTYQPAVFTSLVSFLPSMGSTRYMFPRLRGSIVLVPPNGSTLPQTFTTSNGTGQICY